MSVNITINDPESHVHHRAISTPKAAMITRFRTYSDLLFRFIKAILIKGLRWGVAFNISTPSGSWYKCVSVGIIGFIYRFVVVVGIIETVQTIFNWISLNSRYSPYIIIMLLVLQGWFESFCAAMVEDTRKTELAEELDKRFEAFEKRFEAFEKRNDKRNDERFEALFAYNGITDPLNKVSSETMKEHEKNLASFHQRKAQQELAKIEKTKTDFFVKKDV